MAVLIVFLYAFIVLIDPYGLLKQGLKRDFYVCSALCLLSFVIAFSLTMKWDIPSPTPLIEGWVKQLH
ncbi:hypothetical protein EJP82_21780 [Paenibacillus anaericanus]|uniref:Uncharacterized protein n=1 Tax=Paenibacillus anaericanus TaxID=170367 RepID=A0A433Y3V3_9BACL|nr:hypothetical protein [Paenibacillus anaericanus]RUT42863.1 hypothetical protein EJP82_21780 [Paenibacillus anaericanus]